MVRADTLLSFLHTKTNIPLFYSCVNTFLSFISHTECSYYTRTGMSADNRSNIMDKYILNAHFLTNQLRHILCIFQAIAVGNHNDLIVPSLRTLHCHVDNLMQRFLTTALFSVFLERTIIILMNDRFYFYLVAYV